MKFPSLKWNEKWTMPALFVLGIVLGIAVCTGVFYGLKLNTRNESVYPGPGPVVTDTGASTSSGDVPEEGNQNPPLGDEGVTIRSRIVFENFELDVQWTGVKKLSHDDAESLFLSNATSSLLRQYIKEALLGYDGAVLKDGMPYPGNQTIWRIGVVQTGPKKGSNIFVMEELINTGMGGGVTYSYLMQDADAPHDVYAIGGKSESYTIFSGNGYHEYGLLASAAVQLPNVTIPSLEKPQTLTLENGKELIKYPQSDFMWATERFKWRQEEKGVVKFVKIAKTRDGQDVYQRFDEFNDGKERRVGCLYVFGPDGSMNRYSLLIPGRNAGTSAYGGGYVPSIIWSDGTANATTYEIQTPSGCGSYDCVNLVDTSVMGDEKTLSIAGKTIDGDNVYIPSTPRNSVAFKQAYDGWYVSDGNKPDIDTFIKRYPRAIFFWKDPLGRWTMAMIQDLIPMAECGKPVIYLYPPKTEAVSVALPKFINVTKSEPAYPSNGWRVIAHPDGSLEYADGHTYPSLYWEGTGVGYQTPKEGFIIKDGEVDAQLASILSRYGLNVQESKDFREFWVPKMTGAPYYRVSFLTSEWSQAAPLFVQPHPNTAIRIFMDWQKLSAPIDLPEPKIETPARNGFTLVEWGGLLR
jgi:hypothetical protein